MTLKSLALVIPETSPLCSLVRRDAYLQLTSAPCISPSCRSSLGVPVISQSVRCIALATMLGLGVPCDPVTQDFCRKFLHSFFLPDLRSELLAVLPVILLSAFRFIPHPSLFCITRTTFPSLPCSLTYLCLAHGRHWQKTGSSGRGQARVFILLSFCLTWCLQPSMHFFCDCSHL